MKKTEVAELAKQFVEIVEERNIDSRLAIASLKAAADIIQQKILQDLDQALMLSAFEKFAK